MFTPQQVKKMTIGKKLDIVEALQKYLVTRHTYSVDYINTIFKQHLAVTEPRLSSLDRKILWLCSEVKHVATRIEYHNLSLSLTA